MDFRIPDQYLSDLEDYRRFLRERLTPERLSEWYAVSEIPRSFFRDLGAGGWLGFEPDQNGGFRDQPVFKQSLLMEELAKVSPGVAVAVLVQISLGAKGIALFGSRGQKEAVMGPALKGDLLLCLGNTEPTAGSDVAGIATRAERVDGGWVLNGTKSFVTNGNIADYALITAVSDPGAERNRRLSMFLVDLHSRGIARRKLHKEVWIPSDLTRIRMSDVFVPEENLVGEPGRGLQQVLEIFTNSRITISALTLGTAAGAFEIAVDHAKKRKIFGQRLVDFQAKSFEIADLYARIEAARLVLWKTCWAKDEGMDFRVEASIAKYLSVEVARAAGMWAADLFGAASVVFEHPVHKFPMDAWASSLGEGTQDVQKLIIFREAMKQAG